MDTYKEPCGLVFYVFTDDYQDITFRFSFITIYTSFVLLVASLISQVYSGKIELTMYMDVLNPEPLI